MTVITTYESDDLVFSVNVSFDAGSGVTSLTGGSFVAFAQKGEEPAVPADGIFLVAPDKLEINFNENTLTEGLHLLQVRATLSGVTQTLVDAKLVVKKSV